MMLNLFKMYDAYKAKKRKKFLLNAFRKAYMSVAERNQYSCIAIKWAFRDQKVGKDQSEKYWNVFRPDSTIGPNKRNGPDIIIAPDLEYSYDEGEYLEDFQDALHEWRVTAICFAMAMIEAGDWE